MKETRIAVGRELPCRWVLGSRGRAVSALKAEPPSSPSFSILLLQKCFYMIISFTHTFVKAFGITDLCHSL